MTATEGSVEPSYREKGETLGRYKLKGTWSKTDHILLFGRGKGEW